jgi:tetratricopeptide (TPR) repeat protein
MKHSLHDLPRQMRALELIRRLKSNLSDVDNARYVFFLGAGCSVSSGIPDARELVNRWLAELKRLQGAAFEAWLKKALPGYTVDSAAKYYARVVEERFPHLPERQAAIEDLVSDHRPGFGYVVLAQLLSHGQCGEKCNVVLTTNFDDLMADALYLNTRRRPLVIAHESLAGFADRRPRRPLIVKLHGDAQLYPKNTESEVSVLGPMARNATASLLRDAGLIFIGYGGWDRSITSMLQALPPEAANWGTYWVGPTMPSGGMGKWLRDRDAVWVDHFGFDELMLYVFLEFGLQPPDSVPFQRLTTSFRESFNELCSRVAYRDEGDSEKHVLTLAVERVTPELGPAGVFARAESARRLGDLEGATRAYEDGVRLYPDDPMLLCDYARFLSDELQATDRAECYYQRATALSPANSRALGDYAFFLQMVRRDYDRADVLYRRALAVDPAHATNLLNYAHFLWQVRHDLSQAEAYFARATEAAPSNTLVLAGLAAFREATRTTTVQVSSAEPLDFYTCFISYSEADSEFSERLYNDLQSRGVRCWRWREDLRWGDDLLSQIDEAVRVYDKLLVILSKSSLVSTPVHDEIVRAIQKETREGKQVLFPITLDDSVFTWDHAYAANVRAKHVGDFRNWQDSRAYARALDRLLRDLRQ